MDDFDYDIEDELHRDDSNNRRSAYDRISDAKDKYDDIKDKVDKAKEFKNKMRSSTQAAKNASNAANAGGTATAGGTAATGGAAAGGAAAGGTAAGGAAAGGAAAGGAAAGGAAAAGTAGAAAAAGAATAGIGAVVVAALAAANELKKKLDKRTEEQKEKAKIRKKRTKRTIILTVILLPFILTFLTIMAGALWLASEETYTDLATIIQKREKRYAEAGKVTKPLLLMNDTEIGEIINKDYDKNATLIENRDISYETYLKENYNKEYDNLIPTLETDPANPYSVKSGIVKSYLKAERENFNKVKWNLVALSGNIGDAELKQYDTLKMPNITKYKYSPTATEDQMKTMYVDMLYKHLQMWVIPYSLNIASSDNVFGADILNNMWHPITVSLYQLDRLTQYTTTYYYLATNVHVDYYTEHTYSITNPDGTVTVITYYVYSHSSEFESTTSSTWTSSNTVRYTVTLKKDDNNEYIRAGVKSGPTVSESQVPYRHVPKATDVQDFYNVIKAKYKIDPIDKNKTPVEKIVVLDSSGKEVITKIWDEELLDDGTEIKDYKVSYYTDENYNKLGRKISRVEWFQDYGYGPNEIYPSKTDDEKYATKLKYKGEGTTKPLVQEYSYLDLDFGYQQIEKHFSWLETNGVTGTGSLNAYFIPAGGFYWPVQAVLGRGTTIDDLITSKFGTRTDPVNGTPNSFHGGIDITHGGIGNPGPDGNSNYGPDIVAARDGIAYVKNDPDGYGKYVVIDHKNGYYTLYGHLYSISVTDGQSVTQGQKIGVMGTRGHSTGVHLHFEIIEAGSISEIYNKNNKRDPRLFFNDDGSTILPASETLTAFGQQTIGDMVAKAISMASNADILYRQTGRQTASTISGLDNLAQTDCSAFVYSMFKTYLNIDVNAQSERIMEKGQGGYSENGWKAQIGDYNGDTSVLRPGDILWRSGHVGIYVGNGKQVDHGGPGGVNSEDNPSWKGPLHRNVSSTYTKFIRYTHQDAYVAINSGGLTAVDPTNIDLTGVLSDPRTLECFRVLLAGEMGTMSGLSGIDATTVGSYTQKTVNASLFTDKYNSYTYRHSWTGTDYQMGRVAVATTVVNRAAGDASKLFGVMTAKSQYTTVTGYTDKSGEYANNLKKYKAYSIEEKNAIDSAIKIAITNSNNGYSVIGDCRNFWSYDYYMSSSPTDKLGLYNIAGNLFFKYK